MLISCCRELNCWVAQATALVVAPAFTVFSVGAGNRFGFPNPEVVARTPGEHFSTAEGAIVAESEAAAKTHRMIAPSRRRGVAGGGGGAPPPSKK